MGPMEHQDHLEPGKKYISEEYLLETLNNVFDCGDMVFPDGRDHICGPTSDCSSFRWWDTLAWVKEVVKNVTGITTTPPV